MYFHTCNMYIWIMYDWVRAFQNWRTLDFHSHLWGQHNSFLLSSPRKHFHVFRKLMVQQMGRRAPKNPRSARLRDWRMVSKNPGQSGQTYWAGGRWHPKPTSEWWTCASHDSECGKREVSGFAINMKTSICVQETPGSKVCARLLWYRTVNSKGCSSLRSGSIVKQDGLESRITVFYCTAGNVSSKINKVIKHIARELNFIFLSRQSDPIQLRKAVCWKQRLHICSRTWMLNCGAEKLEHARREQILSEETQTDETMILTTSKYPWILKIPWNEEASFELNLGFMGQTILRRTQSERMSKLSATLTLRHHVFQHKLGLLPMFKG